MAVQVALQMRKTQKVVWSQYGQRWYSIICTIILIITTIILIIITTIIANICSAFQNLHCSANICTTTRTSKNLQCLALPKLAG